MTATLALVLALGGTTYAATKVTSATIQNGTIRGIDVKKDTLTGVQINESKLGPINRARSAKNADNLGGQPPTFWEKSTRIQVARALSTQVNVNQSIIVWPEMGIAVQTDGDADDRADVRVVSTRVAGAPDIKVTLEGGGAAGNANLQPGAAVVLQSPHEAGSLTTFIATDNGGISGPGYMLWVTCKANNHGTTQDSQLYCMAIRSTP